MGHQMIISVISVIFIHLVCQVSSDVENHYSSTYGSICYDSCRTNGEDYYWCNTRKGWDYCSPRYTDYKGVPCQEDHPCGKYGETYYWCKNIYGNWNKCGRVEPKTLLHISSTYQKICIDDCSYDQIYEYYWCYTGEEKEWDYCSPHSDVTYKKDRCKANHHCGTHGSNYSWCYTSSDWDYCGVVQLNKFTPN